MTQPKKQVSIHLKTAIKDGRDTEKNEIHANGIWLKKGGLDVIRFKEEMDETAITTMITIQARRVTVKRSGTVSMHQQFQLGERTENVYHHPHGNLHMETFTDQVMYQTPAPGVPGRLIIDYTVILNGQIKRKHTLELLFEEEDA